MRAEVQGVAESGMDDGEGAGLDGESRGRGDDHGDQGANS